MQNMYDGSLDVTNDTISEGQGEQRMPESKRREIVTKIVGDLRLRGF